MNKIDFTFSDLIAGYVTRFDESGDSFGLSTSDGREFQVHVAVNCFAELVRNLGEAFKDATGAMREMLVPGALAVVVPLVLGFIDVDTLGGFLAGALVTGFALAIFMANAGGAWDNAKKYIEAGAHGGKGSEPHKAAVVGDTVGDPFKDTSGPSMNILINVMAIVSLVIAPLLA